jgi:hypothetical protein
MRIISASFSLAATCSSLYQPAALLSLTFLVEPGVVMILPVVITNSVVERPSDLLNAFLSADLDGSDTDHVAAFLSAWRR